jgi:hypothetical protein
MAVEGRAGGGDEGFPSLEILSLLDPFRINLIGGLMLFDCAFPITNILVSVSQSKYCSKKHSIGSSLMRLHQARDLRDYMYISRTYLLKR